MSLWQLLRVGGFTMYVLIFCSVLSLAIIIERCVYYRRKSRIKRAGFMASIRGALEKGDIRRAAAICD